VTRKWLPWALAAAALLGGWLYGNEREANGVLSAQLRASESRGDSLARRVGRVDRVFVRDTVRLTRWRDSLVVLRDSLTLTDTVEVRTYIAASDSTIRACSTALDTCTVRVATRDTLIATLRDQLRLRERIEWRPATAVGIAWNAQTGRLGAFLDRDLGRVRFGATVVPEASGAHLGARIGLRF
jgi:hypothetical protein